MDPEKKAFYFMHGSDFLSNGDRFRSLLCTGGLDGCVGEQQSVRSCIILVLISPVAIAWVHLKACMHVLERHTQIIPNVPNSDSCT